MARQDNTTERNYKAHSLAYDQQRFEGRTNRYLEFIRSDAFFSLMPIKGKNSSLKVLDVGCGTGRGAVMIALRGYSVVGIDYTSEMLKIGEDKKHRLNLNNVIFGQGNAKELPFKDNLFDCVVSLNFIHMFGIEPQKIFIDEMTRVLKPGGTLIIEFDNYYKAIFMGGIILGKAKKEVRTHLNKPSNLKFLFEKEKITLDKVSGAVIPYVWRFFQHRPQLALCVERVTRFFPFSYLAERLYVRGIKVDP